MIRHGLPHWPLVLSAAHSAMTREEQLDFFSDWTAWLDRGEAFATLRVFTDSDALKRPEGGERGAKGWLQSNGVRIRQLVIGLATVVPKEVLKETRRMNAEKLFGIPVQTDDDVNEATIRPASVGAEGRPRHMGRVLRSLTVVCEPS